MTEVRAGRVVFELQAVQSVDGDDNLKREIANNLDRAFDQLAPKQ